MPISPPISSKTGSHAPFRSRGSSRHRAGVPASVIPAKAAYANAWYAPTTSTTGPARTPIATSFVPHSSTRNRTVARVNRSRVASAVVATNRSYSPHASTIVPPLTPGTRLAAPISAPAATVRTSGTGPPVGSVISRTSSPSLMRDDGSGLIATRHLVGRGASFQLAIGSDADGKLEACPTGARRIFVCFQSK